MAARKFHSNRDDPYVLPDNSVYCYRNGTPLAAKQCYHPHESTRFRNWQACKQEIIGRLPELYSCREECCGCTACSFVCPIGAIEMESDEEGFDYPVVDAEKCIGCGECLSVCAFKILNGRKEASLK